MRFEPATEVTERVLSFAESEGYLRPLLDFATMIFPLLSDMKAADLNLRQFLHLKAIMVACTVDWQGLVSATPRYQKNRGKGVTRREIEILKLISAGYRYQEIAGMMFISFETVKTHVKHVLGKLEVKTKTQAVRRAQDLRLLDE
ncbi:MAG: LuxR C-terminal-related transcriptional regulator [Syntrophorhabdales bacterium]|jgi:LuxR family maltose regulon positive regulatory protein